MFPVTRFPLLSGKKSKTGLLLLPFFPGNNVKKWFCEEPFLALVKPLLWGFFLLLWIKNGCNHTLHSSSAGRLLGLKKFICANARPKPHDLSLKSSFVAKTLPFVKKCTNTRPQKTYLNKCRPKCIASKNRDVICPAINLGKNRNGF